MRCLRVWAIGLSSPVCGWYGLLQLANAWLSLLDMQVSIILLADLQLQTWCVKCADLDYYLCSLSLPKAFQLCSRPDELERGCRSVEWGADVVQRAVMPYLPDQDAQLPLASPSAEQG